uniref:Uncharacterized protein n=1 Tax=Arundo donax TaxID=35708 RepID=A0A0A9H6P5_ARUDO
MHSLQKQQPKALEFRPKPNLHGEFQDYSMLTEMTSCSMLFHIKGNQITYHFAKGNVICQFRQLYVWIIVTIEPI